MAGTEAKVDTPCLAYQYMYDNYWKLIIGLRSGTKGMRDAAELWLPREDKEDLLDYDNRLSRSFLYPGYEDGIARLVAKPFVKPVTVNQPMPVKLTKWQDNVDRQGTDLTKFSKAFMQDSIDFGLSHILVDYPKDGIGMDLFEQNKKEVKGEIYPYWTHIKAEDLIGWRSEKYSSGERKLTQIRIKQKRVEQKGLWGEEQVTNILVINDDKTWELWKKGEDDSDFYRARDGKHNFPKIPLFTYYTNQTGFMEAKPPLYTLAETNLEHWQSYSDHRNFLRFIRIGILTVAGCRKKDFELISIGPNKVCHLGELPGAEMKYVEHKGEAIGAGERDLERLEARMMFLSLLPAMKKSGDPTATGEALEASRSNTVLQSWIRGAENTETNALKFQAEGIGQPFKEEMSVNIFNNFVIGLRSAADVELLFKMVVSQKIPVDIFLEEMVKHGVLPDDMDVKTVAARIESMGLYDQAEFDRDEDDDEKDKDDEEDNKNRKSDKETQLVGV